MTQFKELITDKHCYVILSHLLEHGETKQNDLYGTVCRNHMVILSKLERLKSYGLVTGILKECGDSRHTARYWMLTTKGRVLIEHLAVAEGIMEGEFDLEENSMKEAPGER